MNTIHQTIQQIKANLNGSEHRQRRTTINGVDLLALCNALEIAVKALERRIKRQPVNAKDALAQIEAMLAKLPLLQ